MKLKFLATAAALLLAGNAQAAIVTFSTPVPITNNFNGTDINFRNGVSGPEGSVTGWDLNIYNQSTAIGFFWNNTFANTAGGVAATAASGPYLSLAPGAVVSAASIFTAAVAPTAAFQSAGNHILGFRFYNEGLGAVNYGYLNITNGGAGGFPATVTSWSYEDTGGAITVPVPGGSAVPEPASWALMIGGFGLVGGAMRRRATIARFVRA